MEVLCPDGFLLTPRDPLRVAHERINDFLIAEEQRNAAKVAFDVSPWRKLPKRELPQQTVAVLSEFAGL